MPASKRSPGQPREARLSPSPLTKSFTLRQSAKRLSVRQPQAEHKPFSDRSAEGLLSKYLIFDVILSLLACGLNITLAEFRSVSRGSLLSPIVGLARLVIVF